MSILAKLTDFVGGSLFKEIKDTVVQYLPPDMTPQQKAEAELKLQELLHKKQIDAQKILNESAAQLDARIREQEGTAKDLKTIPILGSIILFARGCQRPFWGFFTAYLDYKWLVGGVVYTEMQELALVALNVLVLGFLFGERTVQNVLPLITRWLDARKVGK